MSDWKVYIHNILEVELAVLKLSFLYSSISHHQRQIIIVVIIIFFFWEEDKLITSELISYHFHEVSKIWSQPAHRTHS